MRQDMRPVHEPLMHCSQRAADAPSLFPSLPRVPRAHQPESSSRLTLIEARGIAAARSLTISSWP